MKLHASDIAGFVSKCLWKLAPKRLVTWQQQIDLIRSRYRHRVRRELNLFSPVRFSEKMQWRKLFVASKLFTQLSDKIAVRDYIAEKGFASMLIPQLWAGDEPRAIPFDDLQRPFVLKSTHACGHVVIVMPDQLIDRDQIVGWAEGWLAHCHGTAFVEPGYLDVPHRLVVERLLVCANGEPPAEMKVFVFDGVARFVQYVAVTRDRDQRFAFLDRDWKQYPWRGGNPPLESPEKPPLFDQALKAAEALSGNLDHCRVDFYCKDDMLYIGEITLYSFTGMIILRPEEVDSIMGSFWTLRWPRLRAIMAIATRRWGHCRAPLFGFMRQ